VSPRALAAVSSGLAVAAAFLAVRTAWFATALWLTLLLAVLALAPCERRLVHPAWAGVGLALLAVGWVVALDHELALRLSLLCVAATLAFGLARLARLDDRALTLVGLGLAATAAVAFQQVASSFDAAMADVGDLPLSLREAAATRLETGRATGTSSLPGHFAVMLVLAAPLLAGGAVRSQGWRRWGLALALLPLLGGLVLSRSLAGLIVAAVLVFLAGLRTRARWWVAAAAGSLGVAAALVVAARGDLGTLEPLVQRWINWKTTAWVMARHPWLGVGLGGVGQAGLLAPEGAASLTPYTHNSYLQWLAEFGLAGAGALGAAVWSLARLVRDGLREHLPLALAVAAVPLHNLIDFSFYAPEVVLPWAVVLGALVARLRPLPARPLPSSLLLAVLGGGFLLAALSWRGEVEVGEAVRRPEGERPAALLDAAEWTPWAFTPLAMAVEAAQVHGAGRETLDRLDAELLERAWVRPRSSAWAEARALTLLAAGHRGEALVWAREARRRAPAAQGLATLERACAP
jgi:hypothetical protein